MATKEEYAKLTRPRGDVARGFGDYQGCADCV